MTTSPQPYGAQAFGSPGHHTQTHYPQGYPGRGRTPGSAVASMVLGIIAMCFIFLVWVPVIGWISFGPAVLAIIFGGVALSQMSKDPSLQGKGMAVAGLVLGIIVAAVGVVFHLMFLGL